MSGCGDDIPDDEDEKRLKIIQRVFQGEVTVVQAALVLGNQRAAVLPDQSTGKEGRS